MKPTHPIELLACAIATQEGWFDPSGHTQPRLKNNPGDIRFAHQLNASAPEWGGHAPAPIATFSSAPTGIAGLMRQLWLQAAEGQTVAQIIAQWAPPVENQTTLYLRNVLEWTGLPADVPVLDLLPHITQVNKAEIS